MPATAMTSSPPRSPTAPALRSSRPRSAPRSPKDAPLLVVPDVLEGLRDLARASRARSEAKVIGVTGSVGKTGTKEALRLALTPSGETHASVASYNNHWGVPLSLARCPASARFAVFEMGMNHAGEIEPLSQLVQPHVAIVTTIAPVHLEYLGSIEAIADAKAEIFRGLVAGGAAVINRDIPQYQRLARAAESVGARVVSFGEHAKADARLITSSLHADCSTVQARILGADVTYKLGAPGRHVVMNSLAVLAAASLAGADLALAALALAGLAPPTGRGARSELELPGGRALLIDESYNANPASMQAAIALLGQADVAAQGRRIAVLGDMLELGPSGAELHRGAGRAGGRAGHRPRLLLRPADAFAVGGPSLRAPGGVCGDLGRARTTGAGRHPSRRRRHDQGIARVADGSYRQGAGTTLFPQRARGAEPRLIH